MFQDRSSVFNLTRSCPSKSTGSLLLSDCFTRVPSRRVRHLSIVHFQPYIRTTICVYRYIHSIIELYIFALCVGPQFLSFLVYIYARISAEGRAPNYPSCTTEATEIRWVAGHRKPWTGRCVAYKP